MSQRLLRVRELLQRELGALLQRELEFGSCLVSIHDLELTPDLKSAKVFIGVLGGGPHAGARVLEKLEKHRGVFQSKISKRVVLKHTPTLRFVIDDSVERGVRTLQLLDEIGDPDETTEGGSEQPSEDARDLQPPPIS